MVQSIYRFCISDDVINIEIHTGTGLVTSGSQRVIVTVDLGKPAILTISPANASFNITLSSPCLPNILITFSIKYNLLKK